MYKLDENKIIINNLKDFNIAHILECGQVFRYEKINTNHYTVISKGFKAEIKQNEDYAVITSSNIGYFVNYFDLNRDYGVIKDSISTYPIIEQAINHGYGIRILNQDLVETIISFIISANNNIKRIQKSLNYISEHLGEKVEDYYTFPSLDKLYNADEEFFVSAGTGYRAKYLKETISDIYTGKLDLMKLLSLPTDEARKYLCTFKGIGEKVANCILLFGLHREEVFPVDTWMEKVYRDYFYAGDKNPSQITRYMVDKFKDLSGYAQQYLFYYKRELKD